MNPRPRLAHRPTLALTAIAALPVLLSLLGGCAPEPSPVPTPTPAFTSEAEAFAAAEEVYRAYLEAFNDIDLDDPATFEPVFSFATGDFQEADRTTLSELHAEGYSFSGTTELIFFEPLESSPRLDTLTAIVCVDVSKSDVTAADGLSVLPESRPDVNPLLVRFVSSGSTVLIEHADRHQESECNG